MKALRWLRALVVVAYAGWLLWPLIEPFVAGSDRPMARATVEAAREGINLPLGIVWIAAGGLYLLSALLLGNGNPRAFMAYLLGFAADAFLKIALQGSGADSPTAKGGPLPESAIVMSGPADAAAGGVDPLWWAFLALAVLGGLVFIASRRRRRAAQPLSLG